MERRESRVRRSETTQTFSRWIFGDLQGPRAAGLYVGTEGVAGNHHFLIPNDETQYKFLQGDYVLEVHGSIVNQRAPILLKRLQLSLNAQYADAINQRQTGVIFNWSPETMKYIPETRPAPPPSHPGGAA